jgi:hypothetical protein
MLWNNMMILIKLKNKFNYNYKKEIMINKLLMNGLALLIIDLFINL